MRTEEKEIRSSMKQHLFAEDITTAEEKMIVIMAILSMLMVIDSIMHGGLFTSALAGVIR